MQRKQTSYSKQGVMCKYHSEIIAKSAHKMWSIKYKIFVSTSALYFYFGWFF